MLFSSPAPHPTPPFPLFRELGFGEPPGHSEKGSLCSGELENAEWGGGERQLGAGGLATPTSYVEEQSQNLGRWCVCFAFCF